MSSLSLNQAEQILNAALSRARQLDTQPVAVMVLDAGGHPVAMRREDGASFYRTDIAKAKAHGAIGMGMDTRTIADKAQKNPIFFGSLSQVDGVNLALSAGGVLIRTTEGEIIGSVGVSGDTPDNDEAVALAGIEAAQLSHGVNS
ncbi:heme-binding protein [Halioxenophilus sp. WMMB6]|uniref:GlcG/HbpS family heme-binding protein n=1 Tax=Halioxenophilus sp. WMMB6 TaxID=3073815 RepID=UPI00295E913B|nr:heme-binding protein [Halioxenophilus sp. WMMB6]